MTRRIVVLTMTGLISLGISVAALAQQPTQGAARQQANAPAPHPSLFFRLDWVQPPDVKGEHSITQEGVKNPNLELKLYGPNGKDIEEVGTSQDPNNPVHLWTGLCTGACGIGLRDKSNYVDLTGFAKIKWLTKVTGFHQVRPIVKLADGTWLVGDHADGSTTDWNESEFSIADVRWRKLDIDKVVTATGPLDWVEKPDLSKVDEVGFADLMPGSGHGAHGGADLIAWIEVYGKPVSRNGTDQLNSKASSN